MIVHCDLCSSEAGSRGAGKETKSKDEVLAQVDADLDSMTIQLANYNDPVIAASMARVATMRQIATNTSGAEQAMATLTQAELNKFIPITGSGNSKYKYEACAKVFFAGDYTAMAKKKANITMIDQMMVNATQRLLNSQFMGEHGEMSWTSADRNSLSGAVTNLISQGSYAAGVARAAAEAAAPAAQAAAPAGDARV